MSATGTILRAQRRYWQRHRLQAGLCLLGIVIGVAVYVAILLANQGALQSFRRGIADLTGSATHRVVNPAGAGIPDAVYAALARLPGVEAAAPRMQAAGRLGERAISVLGIEPIADVAFRPLDMAPARDAAAPDGVNRLLERLIAEPGAVLLPRGLAAAAGVEFDRPITVMIRGAPVTLLPIGTFGVPEGRAATFANTLVTDVSTFQERIGSPGRVQGIDLILGSGAAARVAAALPTPLRLELAGSSVARVETMSGAFHFNLQALGGFALLVAMFLIFNAAMFSVVQRSGTLAVMRCLGASRGRILLALLAEAGLLGLVGGVVGILLGRLLAQAMIGNTAATLFEVILNERTPALAVHLDAATWAIGLALSVGTAIGGALWPALEAARLAPLAALRGSRAAPEARLRVHRWVLGSALCGLVALGLVLPSRGPLAAGTVGATAVALAGAMLAPPLLVWCSRLLSPLLGRWFGPAGRIAGRSLGRDVTRTGLATAALMVALALALAIQITVGSFRDTFIVWLEQTVQADIYLQPVQDGDRRATFTPARMAALRALPGVQDAAELKTRRVLLGGREVTVLGVDAAVYLRRGGLPLAGAAVDIMARALAGEAVLVSETLARPLGLSAGDLLALPTPGGVVNLPIAAVVQNYGQPAGVVYLGKARFTHLFGPVPTERAALWVAPGTATAQVQSAVERLPVAAFWHVQPSATLRGEALAIFDRTFLITDLLGALAAVIAFIAVVSALTALLEERTRLLGYMRAIGLSARRLGWALALEAMLIALVAGVLSWVTGLLMSVVLVYVLNPRAFGWTLQFHPGHGAYGSLLLMAVVAALLGSLYPIYRATGLAVAATIREE